MDYEILRGTLRATLEEVAFIKDDDDKNVSILGQAQNDLKEYLDENTAITENEKAKIFANFLTSTITSVTTQAIIIAGQAPLQDAQAKALAAETAQKIISMKNEDKARLNDSAVNVSKAKVEIEKLIPAQIAQIESSTALEDKKLDIADKDLELKTKDLELKDKSLTMEDKKIDLMDEDIKLKVEDIKLKGKALETENMKILLSRQEIRLKSQEVNYKMAQINAINEANVINQKIEEAKNETSIKVATIHATA